MQGECLPNVRQKRASLIKAAENIKKVMVKRKHCDDEYEVESIISHTVNNEQTIYTVTWVGYPGETTEMTEDDLKNCRELLQEYKSKISGCESVEAKSGHDLVLRSENDKQQSPSTKNPNGGLSSSPIKNVGEDNVMDDTADNATNATSVISTQETKKRITSPSTSHVSKPSGNTPSILPKKRARKAKHQISPDDQLGYTNGCIVDAYKGFSNNYSEPVVLVSYKEPLPCGFEKKQDEIVPIRLIAKEDPQRLITHLVELLSSGNRKTAI